MIYLRKGFIASLQVIPRGFQKIILIDEQALDALLKAQSLLPKDIEIIITRGYQNKKFVINALRVIGSIIFYFLYRERRNQIKEIFGHNGHSTDGNHVDLDIKYKGQRLILLPFSVFTPQHMIDTKLSLYSDILDKVYDALKKSGFTIHKNKTESLQIHCDLVTR